MYEQVLAWAVLTVLLVLCLPLAGITRLLLAVASWGLRLALVTLLVAAGYLWFYPDQFPAEVMGILNGYPRATAFLPYSGTPYFGVGVIAPVVALLLPVLAALDVFRKLSGLRLHRHSTLAANVAVAAAPPASVQAPAPAARAADRRTAADAMAAAARRPGHSPRPAP